MEYQLLENRSKSNFRLIFRKKANAIIADIKRLVEDVRKDFLLNLEITTSLLNGCVKQPSEYTRLSIKEQGDHMNYLVNIANIIIKLELVNDQDILPMASRFFLSNGGKPDITIQVNVVKNVNNSKRLIPDVQTSAWTMANIDGQKKFEFLDNGITTAQMLVNEDYTQITLDISRSSLHEIKPIIQIYPISPVFSRFMGFFFYPFFLNPH